VHGRVVKPRRRVLAAVCLAAVRFGLILGAACGCAQAQTAVDGALAGRVALAPGQTAAGVRVVVRAVDSPATAVLVREIKVGNDGSFLILRLPAGEYTVEAVRGTQIVARGRVNADLGAVNEVTLQERPSQATGHPVLGLSTVAVNAEALAQLPLEDRRWQDASQVSSEVSDAGSAPADSTTEDDSQPDAALGGRSNAGTLLSFRGIAPTQNASLLDGVSGDQGFRGGGRGNAPGGPRAQSNFGQGAVHAFSVAAHSYSAQYGGGAGGLLTTATRAGSGALHGGGFYLARESAWAAANPFSVETHYRDGVISNSLAKSLDSQQSFGGRLGGAVLRKRLFGFASLEEQLRNFPAVSSPSTANFYALTATQTALLGTRGVSAAATNAALNYLDSLTGEVPRTANQGVQFARLDVRASDRDTVTLSYQRLRLSSPAGVGGGASGAVVARGTASLGDSTVRTDGVTARWLRLSSPRVTNEVRGQFARDLEFEQPRTPLAQEPGISPGGYAPQVAIGENLSGGFAYGTPAALGRNAYPDEQRVQLADVMQYAPGRHLFTLGFDWSRVHDRVDALNNLDGSFTYDSGAIDGRAGGLVDWITDYTFNVHAYPNGGCPSINAVAHDFCFRSYTQSFGAQQVEFTMHEFAGFAQDLWRVRPGLVVELGARYEYMLLPLPQQPNVVLDEAFKTTGATSVFPEDRNNAGPRIAMAWSPKGGRWGTARVGYGAYFGRLPGSRVRAALLDTAMPATDTHIRITPTTVTVCPQVANQGFGYPCAYVSQPPAAVAATTSADIFAHNFRLPAVQQAELTLERAAGRGFSIRATYSMAIATQLPNTVDVNIAPSTGLGQFVLQGGDGRVGSRDGETFVVPMYGTRLLSQFGAVTALESNANATWHGLTAEARLRRGGVEAHGSYTWSKAIDYGAEQGATPRVNGQFDPFSVGYDKGLADANFPQRFAGDLVWLSRLERGPNALRKVLGGWRVSALGTAGSGRPYSYEIFGGTYLSGGSYSINGSGGSAWLPTVGRNTLRLPARWNVDARVGRGFRITERVRGEGYVEAFNVTNHVNISQVNARAFLVGAAVNGVVPLVFQNAAAVMAEGLNTPPFGTVTSSTIGLSHERQAQVGLRIEF
jgi:hypothetical protein